MAVAHVQTTKTVSNAGSQTTVTGAMTTTAGNLLLVAALEFGSIGSNLQVVTSCKLGGVTAFTSDRTFAANTSGSFQMRCTWFSLPNAAGGSNTVTVDWGNSVLIPTNVLIFFMEVSGAITTAAADGAGAGASGVGTASASGSFNTTNSNDFIVCATTSLAANPATYTPGTSFTIPTNGTETNSAANLCGGVEFWANPAATTFNGAFTLKTGDWVNVATAYKAAAGGGATSVVNPSMLTTMGMQ